MFTELFNVTSPVLIIGLIGYLWVKRGFEYPTEFVTRINMNFGAPCLTFVGILSLGDDISSATNFMFASFLSILTMLILSIIFVFSCNLPKRAYIIALSSTNCGNMGIPLSLFAFGEMGMAFAIAYFVIGSLFQFTVSLYISHGSMNPTALLRVSMIWGIIAAAFFIATDITPPTWLMNTTQLLSGVTIPLMLLTLGASLAKLPVINFGKISAIAIGKIAIGMSIGIGVAHVFGFQGIERNVLILQMSMPVAVFSYLLASKYNRNPENTIKVPTDFAKEFILTPEMLKPLKGKKIHHVVVFESNFF